MSLPVSGPDNWAVSHTSPPVVHVWDGEYIVFNPLSGRTHFLDTVAGEILKAVVDVPASERDLCGRVAAFLQVPHNPDLLRLVTDALRGLEELGLIERRA